MKSLCLFLPTGKTFSFKGVSIRTNNETALEFSYQAMSDNKVKYGFFQKNQIVGFSVLDDSPAVEKDKTE